MKKPPAFTIVEICIVLVILAILAGVAISGYSGFREYGNKKDAKIKLKLIYSAQENFYSFQNTFTADWDKLAIQKPDDDNYIFEIISADSSTLNIKATRVGTDKGFFIDESGNIQEF
jgi:Tfp pilus assembly protein PilE